MWQARYASQTLVLLYAVKVEEEHKVWYLTAPLAQISSSSLSIWLSSKTRSSIF